ncbi:MAG: alpha/beta hydrolase [Pseudomonadota bacterium]
MSAYRWLRWVIATMAATVSLLLLAGAYTANAVSRVEAAFPPHGDFIDTALGRQHYLDTGERDAPVTLVLLHGASSNLREFERSLVPVFQDRYRLLLFDRPGYGYSERLSEAWASPRIQAAVLHEALTKLGVSRPVLVGHSWSGALILAYALAYPDETRAVVSLGGATHPWKSGVAWHIALSHQPIAGPLFTHTLFYPAAVAAADGALEYIYAPESVPTGLKSDIGMELSLRPNAYASSSEDVARLSDYLKEQRERYAELKVPMLMITGSDDQVVPGWNHARRFNSHPRARVVVLEGAGHGLHHTRGADIAREVERTLAKAASSGD